MADVTEKVKYFGWLAVCPEKERGSQYCNATWRRKSKDSNTKYKQSVCLGEKEFSNCTFLLSQSTENNLEAEHTYAFFPQMACWYQFLQVLKYFFFVPITC